VRSYRAAPATRSASASSISLSVCSTVLLTTSSTCERTFAVSIDNAEPSPVGSAGSASRVPEFSLAFGPSSRTLSMRLSLLEGVLQQTHLPAGEPRPQCAQESGRYPEVELPAGGDIDLITRRDAEAGKFNR